MKLSYQIATPDVTYSPNVTAFQGPLDKTIKTLSSIGYNAVECMTVDPANVDILRLEKLLQQNNMEVALVCTGELYGQLGLSLNHKLESVRREAINKVKQTIDMAKYFNTDINLGRVKGCYFTDVPREISYGIACESLREVSEYAEAKDVQVALETVNIVQTNFINTLEEGVKLIKDVGCDKLKVMMDIFHMYIEETSVEEAIEKYSDYNIYVHLSDKNRKYPGALNMDFEGIIKKFSECGYDGTFTVECLQIPDQLTCAQNSYAYLKPIFDKYYK